MEKKSDRTVLIIYDFRTVCFRYCTTLHYTNSVLYCVILEFMINYLHLDKEKEETSRLK